MEETWSKKTLNLAALVIACLFFLLSALWLSSFNSYYYPRTPDSDPSHPIDDLIRAADEVFLGLSTPQAPGVVKAAAIYRERRGRHPPPFFDQWVKWAEAHDAFTSEAFFDQIYDDLEPFWAIPPLRVRTDAGSWTNVITIRDGKTRQRTTIPLEWANWLGKWQDMIKQIPSGGLPDVDLAFNADDEPHIFVPFEDVQSFKARAGATKHTKGTAEIAFVMQYARYPALPDTPTFRGFPEGLSEHDLWRSVRETCPPDSKSRDSIQDDDFSTPPIFPNRSLDHMENGFVKDWSASKAICDNPHLRNLHGFFVGPKEISRNNWEGTDNFDPLRTRTLFPLFSVAKLRGINNDILVPPPPYYADGEKVHVGAPIWSKKENKVFWIGGAHGGTVSADNWCRFHRSRFVSMMNSTQVEMTLAALTRSNNKLPPHVPGGEPSLPHNFPLPDPVNYPLAAFARQDLSSWISKYSEVQFQNWGACHIHVNATQAWHPFCDDILPFYSGSEGVKMEDWFVNRYLPDMDGYSYTGRFLPFLRSDSLPIKATIWSEWHDNRLVPWRHFVPMDITMIDWYAIMEYFVGYKKRGWFGTSTTIRRDHDDVAKKIAHQGRDWAEKAFRREDMVLYMWRLILEFARICDDNRDRMGWVEDLR